MIITLDGPAGSGKSTIAHLLAKRLNVDFLDTGAMYRAISAACLAKDIDPAVAPEAMVSLAKTLRLYFDWKTDPPRLHVVDENSDVDITDRLRDADVTSKVSDVAQSSPIRKILVAAQQQIGRDHPRLVTEGRDQGSVVFPDAFVKFYLDASPEIRATRRVKQLQGMNKPADYDEIIESIIARDRRDFTREDGPLVCTPDAIRVDTSSMPIDEVVDHLEQAIRAKQ